MMPSASPFSEGTLCSDFYLYDGCAMSSYGLSSAVPTPSTASPAYLQTGHRQPHSAGDAASDYCDDAFFETLTAPALTATVNTSSKTLSIFAEPKTPADAWMKKEVHNWDTSDTIAWLVDVAKRHRLSDESIFSGAFSNIKGTQLLQMTLRDYERRDPHQGRYFFEAAQQLHQHHGQQLLHRSTLDENVNTILELSHSHFQGDASYCWPMDPYAERHDFDPAGSAPSMYSLGPQEPAELQDHLAMSYPESVACYPYSVQEAALLNQGIPTNTLGSLPRLEKIQTDKMDSKLYPEHGSLMEMNDSGDYGLGDSVWSCDGDVTSDMEDNYSGIDPAARKVGRPKGRTSGRRSKTEKSFGRLWEFIRDLLHNPDYCPSMVRWENVDEGIFRIVKSDKLAELWGTLKHNPNMTYEKLSRAMRYYYKGKIFEPVIGRRLVYKFGHNATNWRPKQDPNFENRNRKEIL